MYSYTTLIKRPLFVILGYNDYAIPTVYKACPWIHAVTKNHTFMQLGTSCLATMRSKVLYTVIALILAAELQLTSCQEGATSQHDNSSLPVSYSATVLEGGGQICPPEEQMEMARAEIAEDVLNTVRNIFDGRCPGQVQENPASSCLDVPQCDPQLPSEHYWITSSNGTAVQVYCDMARECSCGNASVGGWSRVAYLNMTDPTHQCPPAWREITEPVRTCGRTNESVPIPSIPSVFGGCSSVSFSTYNISFSHICGRIIGYQFATPDAFHSFFRSWYTRIEDPYVDGVVITRGTEKEHVWTFAAGSESDRSIPSFVGQDYFCEARSVVGTGPFYSDDPLWDGEDCGSESTCCNHAPFFCKSLTEPTTDDIEVRICGDERLSNEDTPIELIEIFLQ